jgi:type III restriction enzyme
MTAIIDNPILNSPFAEPARHWLLDEQGIPSGAIGSGRRRSEFVVPVPPPRHRTQGELDLEDEYGKRKPNDAVNEIRGRVAIWRKAGRPGVTPVTRRLIQHWESKDRSRRLFFCQIEAAETAIWLAEVAPRADIERLRSMNPDLLRIALKLATGAGKTTVMAMLIAWQTLNATSRSTRFTDRFLIVAPGITVRDRLRVLLPADANNTYTLHDIVPLDLRDRLHGARGTGHELSS